MKKIILLSSAAIMAAAASATTTLPQDFNKIFGEGENQLEGWTVLAPAGIPAGDYASSLFPDYSPQNAVRILYGDEYCVWTVSQYADGKESDTWLITPEIEVTYDEAVLAFSVEVVGMGSNVSNTYAAYISTGGTDKSDFTLLETGTINGSQGGADYINSTVNPKRILISGYKGKKIRLAIVNEGNTRGIMGFGNISLGSWYAGDYPDAKYFSDILHSEGEGLNLSLRVSTPVACSDMKVDFQTAEGFTYSTKISRSLKLSTVSTLTVSIPDIELSQPSSSYTLTLTPDYENAGSMVISGYLIQASKDFAPVAVLEEATGTWCGWCPYGAAALAYYSDFYNGNNGDMKVIPIAIHGDDPMEISNSISDYYESWMWNLGSGGFPYIVVNRTDGLTPSPNPNLLGNILSPMSTDKSYAGIKLDKVVIDDLNDGSLLVDFTVSTSYATQNSPLRVAAIVTENNVQGNNSQYNQTTFVAQNGDNASRISSRLGQAWLPYFEPYFGISTLGYSKIQYPHVARASFPDFEGMALQPKEADKELSDRISFNIPKNVRIKENISVSVILMQESTGEILSADELNYYDFLFLSGIDNIKQDGNIEISLNNGQLKVTTFENGVLNVFASDGNMVIGEPVAAGTSYFDADSFGNMLIVKVSTPSATKTAKLLNK